MAGSTATVCRWSCPDSFWFYTIPLKTVYDDQLNFSFDISVREEVVYSLSKQLLLNLADILLNNMSF